MRHIIIIIIIIKVHLISLYINTLYNELQNEDCGRGPAVLSTRERGADRLKNKKQTCIDMHYYIIRSENIKPY